MNDSVEQMPTDTLLQHCALSWGLHNLIFVRKMENIVFRCDSDQGTVYLRLTTPLRRSRPEIEAEINWMEHLAKSGVPVPRIIPNQQGQQIVSLSEGNQQFEAVVFSEIEGEHPTQEMATQPLFLKKLGALIATMHGASERCHWIKREEWFEERGLRHALEAAKASKAATRRGKLQSAVSWIKQLPRTPENYGLIHADLGMLNLFITKDHSIGIIDFDDSCYHWFVFDLAIVILSMANRFNSTGLWEEKVWLTQLVEGYRTIRPLPQHEVDLIPQFIHFACVRLWFWIEYHETLHTFHEDAIDKVLQVKQWLQVRIDA